MQLPIWKNLILPSDLPSLERGGLARVVFRECGIFLNGIMR
jgi:hypothetical protein